MAGVVALALSVFGCDDSGRPPPNGTGGAGGGTGGAGGGSPFGGSGGAGGAGGGAGGSAPVLCTVDDDCADGHYCDIEEGAFDGTCTPGCRTEPDDCPEGQTCDPDSRECRLPPCRGDDANCPDDQYCGDDDQCHEGCKIDPDNCTPTEDGRAQVCDPETRQCVPLFVCCGADNTCSQTPQDACDGDVLMSATDCSSNPCGPPCGADDECPDGQFCNADGRCEDGCRTGIQGECGPNQACDPDKRTCEDRECDAGAQCEAWQYCDNEGPGASGFCRDGCRMEPGSCGEGQECIPETRQCGERCDPAAVDACGDGRYCDETTNSCRDQCDAHDDCFANEACNFGTNRCEISDCRDDEDIEPNDQPDLENATALELIDQGNDVSVAVIEGKIICPGNPDFFTFRLPNGFRAQVDLVFEQADGNLDLRLHDSEGEVIGEAATLAAPERIRYPDLNDPQPSEDLFIEVFGAEDVQNTYTLRVTVVGAENACFPDPAEFDGGDDSRNDARRIGEQQLPNFREVAEGSICRDDEDWFVFPMNIGDGLAVELRALDGSDALAVELWAASTLEAGGGLGNPDVPPDQFMVEERADGTVVHTWQVPVNESEFQDEDWYLRVRGADAEAIGEYELTLDFSRADVCADDEAEPNDGVAEATDLAEVEGVLGGDGQLPADMDIEVPLALSLCPFDEDFFCFPAAGSNQFTAWATSDAFAGEATVEFVDALGQRRGQAGGINGGEATYATAADGTLCVRVDGLEAANGPYTLHLRRHEPMGGVCAADVPETGPGATRNDESSDATVLMSAFEDAQRYEFRNALVCNPGEDRPDDDWYAFDVLEDDSRICVSVDFDADAGDLDAELYRSEGDNGEGYDCDVSADCLVPRPDPLTGMQVVPGGQCVANRCQPALNIATTSSAPELLDRAKSDGVPADTYYVRVFSEMGDENAYDLTVTVVPNEACRPDWRESDEANDGQQSATFLGGGERRLCDAWLCENGANDRSDQDWYAIDVAPGEEKTVHIRYQNFVDGGLFLETQGPDLMNPDSVQRTHSRFGQISFQCINLRGGELMNRVYIRIRSDGTFHDDGEPDGAHRIDYTLNVVRTDLEADPLGECVVLSGGQGAEVEWPTMELP